MRVIVNTLLYASWSVTLNRNQREELAFEFMLEKEKAGEAFTMAELAEASGWAISSCRTYPTKSWHQYVHRDGHLGVVGKTGGGVNKAAEFDHPRYLSQITTTDRLDLGNQVDHALVAAA